MAHTARILPHQKLRIYRTAKALRRLVLEHELGDADLRRQARRAVDSVVLNIAEGAAQLGNAKKRHYRIAYASAAEVAAAYDAAFESGEVWPIAELFEHVDHIIAVMTKLIRR